MPFIKKLNTFSNTLYTLGLAIAAKATTATTATTEYTMSLNFLKSTYFFSNPLSHISIINMAINIIYTLRLVEIIRSIVLTASAPTFAIFSSLFFIYSRYVIVAAKVIKAA